MRVFIQSHDTAYAEKEDSIEKIWNISNLINKSNTINLIQCPVYWSIGLAMKIVLCV